MCDGEHHLHAGVKAALAAGMNVVAVNTPFTRQRLHESGLLRSSISWTIPAYYRPSSPMSWHA